MAEPVYRKQIIDRLRKRDRFVGQFTRLVMSYSSITESLNLLSLNNKRRTVDDGDGNGGVRDEAKAMHELKSKLGDIIAKKSENDQQLIDATKKIVDLEARLTAVIETKADLENRLREVREQLKAKELEISRLQHTKRELSDEVLALNALNKQLELKFVDSEHERVGLLDRVKEMKEQQIVLLNEFNDKEQTIRHEKVRHELSEAAKVSTCVIDGRNRTLSESGSIGSGMVPMMEGVPSRCFHKMECDDVGEVNDCIFNKTGKIFYTAGSDKTIRAYVLQGDRVTQKAKFIGFSAGINRLDINHDAQLLAGASSDKTTRIYNMDDQRLKCVLSGHSDKVLSARFLTQANKMVTGSLDRTVKIWDINAVRCIKTYFPGSTVTDVATADVTQMHASSHFDKNIRFWDTRVDAAQAVMKFESKITSMCLSADGNKLLCSCRDETLSLIDLRLRTIEHIYAVESFRTSYDFGKCAISPGMKYVAAGSSDGYIYIWDLASTKLEKVLNRNGHETNAVYSLAWHPNNRVLVTTDRRRTCCLWE